MVNHDEGNESGVALADSRCDGQQRRRLSWMQKEKEMVTREEGF